MGSARRGTNGSVGRPARLLTSMLILLLVSAALSVRWLRARAVRESSHEFVGTTMGTSFRVQVDARLSDAETERVRTIVAERLERVDRLMSTYDPDSEVSRFNRHSSTEPFSISEELVEVLGMARAVSERSNGAFDVTVGPLVEAWGFGPGTGPDGVGGPLTDGARSELMESVGYAGITLDAVARTASKSIPATRLDLSGIAKGYGVEQVTAGLRELGLDGFLVDVGGELGAVGTSRGGRPWRVGIERPDDVGGIWGALELADEGIATSGDYRDFFERDGVRYAHIVDPRDGRAMRVRGASVSVVHPNAAMADAWATALTVLGPDEGYEVAAREGLAALFIHVADGELRSRATESLGARLVAAGEAVR